MIIESLHSAQIISNSKKKSKRGYVMKKLKEYAVFKGEEMLAMGTYKEICEKLNISYQTFRYYGTNTYKKRTKEENARRLVCLNDNTEDGELLYILQNKMEELSSDSKKNKQKIDLLKEIFSEYQEAIIN